MARQSDKERMPFPGTIQRQRVARPYTTRGGRPAVNHVMAIVLTPEQEEWLRRWFPLVENARLMAVSGLKQSALHRFARQLGLTKSEQGIKGIKKRQAAHIKRLCERNGYYDSLRGHPLSEECREGVRRMWAEIRSGQRKHPLQIIREKHPARYKRMMQQRSEARTELIRLENFRARFGLARQTRLRIVSSKPYTRRQCNHRWSALKRGYILMTDCHEDSRERWNIYYDDDTQRGEIFERNLVKDGFLVLPLDDEVGELD